MIQSAFASLLLIFLFGLHRQAPGVLLPYDHPANPYAQAAPPIELPPIEGPDIEPVAPDVDREGAKSPPAMPPPTSNGAAPHQHHH